MIKMKRVYEEPSKEDGLRVLVERLWPRGFTKERAAVDLWLKDVAPSPELRRWFGHDPSKWERFCRRYWAELSQKQDLVGFLREKSKEGTVTLVYSARDEEHNAAVALKMLLERHGVCACRRVVRRTVRRVLYSLLLGFFVSRSSGRRAFPGIKFVGKSRLHVLRVLCCWSQA